MAFYLFKSISNSLHWHQLCLLLERKLSLVEGKPMRISLFCILSLIILVPVKSMALEPVNEAHAMFYYQVPFSASKAEQKKHSFGFRMDQASYEPGQMIQYQQLMNKPAAFDFKMGHEGVQGLYVSGVDYLQRYRLSRAAEDEQSGDENGEEGAEASADSDENGKSSNPVTKVAGDIGATIDEIMDMIPLGFIIGGAVALVLVTGAGG